MTKKIDSVAKQWQDFAEAVLPDNVSREQQDEMQKAFYAGAYSILAHMHDILGGPEVSEDDGVVVLEGWLTECTDFYAAIKRSM